MGENPLVSVIIATYNCEKYIEKAVLSALSQSYSNIEVIVVNDGSSDGTQYILQRYEEQIKILYQKNKGVASARNLGIKEAKGEYIAILDADDSWLPTRLEKMMNYLIKNKYDILISNYYYVNEEGNRKYPYNAFQDGYFPPNSKQYETLLWKATAFGLMIVRKKEIMSIDCYDEQLKGEAEDYDLWLRLLQKGLTWGYLPEPLAKIMYRSGSLSRGYSKRRKKALKIIFKKHEVTIGKFKSYVLYRYHLGGYRWDMLIVSIKEKNIHKAFKHSMLMFCSPVFIPIIFYRMINFIYRKGLGIKSR